MPRSARAITKYVMLGANADNRPQSDPTKSDSWKTGRRPIVSESEPSTTAPMIMPPLVKAASIASSVFDTFQSVLSTGNRMEMSAISTASTK